MTTRAPKPGISEAAFQAQVIALAELHGWDWLHVERRTVTRPRPGGRSVTYVETPTKGTLGPGWVDLLLVRDGVALFVELKANGGSLEPSQKLVRERLRDQGMEWRRWAPRDWDEVVATLSRRGR